MRRPRLFLLYVLLLVPGLCGFKPFTPVRNVCPSCPKPKVDQVKLISGETLACQVLAQNDDYYVVTRFGELRAVLKKEIASITWAPESKVATMPSGDQVLLKNGVVLHGTIVDHQPGRLLIIKVGGARHIAWFNQIETLHRNGRQQDLTAAAARLAPTAP